jgi:hypothetical protein
VWACKPLRLGVASSLGRGWSEHHVTRLLGEVDHSAEPPSRASRGFFFHMLAAVVTVTGTTGTTNGTWTKLADGPWSAREGLMAVEAKEGVYLTGGRAFFGSAATKDVWFSINGSSWSKRPAASFSERAYHAMFSFNDCIYVMGGQKVSFVGNPFYNDVWESCDGAQTWQSLGNAPWTTRAGLGFATFDNKMVIGAGCYGGSIGPSRLFLNDVWSSSDGRSWEQLTSNASWSPRSGPRMIGFNGKLYLIAGEVGFTADTQLVDIWSSDDGTVWTLVTASPGFSPRSGHGVVVHAGEVLMIAGWPELHDLWASQDMLTWELRSNSTWNCNATKCGKFDFWPLVTSKGTILTVGGSNAYSTFGKMWADTWELTC